MATFAIGDVQGCYDALVRLLERIGFSSRRDRLWFVGDLVNRGPQSLEVLRFVRSLGDAAVVVLGNHDLHLIALAAGHAPRRPRDTLDAVLAAPDSADLLEWLRVRPLAHRDASHFMVHAGLLPSWSMERARDLAAEVETALRGPDYPAVLAALSGDTPDRWVNDLQGTDRLRVIVNAMTRMRFCDAAGVMEFRAKGVAPPAGFTAWFDAPGRLTADVPIVCGHWSALGLHLTQGVVALDTGCVWGGQLTAVRLEDRRVFQVPCSTGHPGTG